MNPKAPDLPLFTLNSVLFPGATIPLQVFEQRYKHMITDCLNEDSQFGIVLIQSGSEVGLPAVPYSIGTLAKIVQCHKVREGRFFLSVEGREPFKIIKINQQRPYLSAEVKFLYSDSEEELLPSRVDYIRNKVIGYYRMLLGLRGGWARKLEMPHDLVALSYFIAGILQISAHEKQKLLEESSPLNRIDLALEFLEREMFVLRPRIASELLRNTSRQ